MPVHDWTRVDAGIFHDFHHAWIEEIKRALNSGLLPEDYYALAEQYAGGFGPDVLTLQANGKGPAGRAPASPAGDGGVKLLMAPPKVQLSGEIELAFYRRKQKAVFVHHVSDDRVVAMVEVVSPGNKGGEVAFRAFVDKAAGFLQQGVHLLILDLQPPSRRDPAGIHAAIWQELTGKDWAGPAAKPLTLVSYDAGVGVRWYDEPVAVGDPLPDMPLYLEPGKYVLVPLETTYDAAWNAVPRRWRKVLDDPG
jgi:hypothetical protein